jgi:hypothetical protein
MRNNEDRLGSKKTSASPAASVAAQSGPAPLEFVRPTTILALPSKGEFYPEGHPLHNQETVEIRQMTTAEEDILSNRTLLRNGLALDKFLERLLIDAKVSPDQLLIGDKNAIMIQARIDGYGNDYSAQTSCPNCSATNTHDFHLESCLTYVSTDDSNRSPQNDRGNFVVTLDNGWEVEIKPLTGTDETKLAKSSENRKKAGLAETVVQDQLNAMIVSVSGHEDRPTIAKAVQHMNGKDSRLLRNAYKSSVPNVELRSNVECQECGVTTEVEVPLNANFFWART